MKKLLISFLSFYSSIILFSQRYDGGASAMHDAMDNAGVKRIGSGMGIGGYFILLILFIIGIGIWGYIDNSNKK